MQGRPDNETWVLPGQGSRLDDIMRWKTFAIGYVLALAILLFAQHRPTATLSASFTHIVDLTRPMARDTQLGEAATLQLQPATMRVTADREPLRFGTRIDAPSLFAAGSWGVDQIPPERLLVPMVVIDVRTQARANPDYQLSVEDIAAWEQVHGHIPPASVVMAYTGWGSRWFSRKAYRNADSRGAMHFPGYSTEAARFLVDGRNVLGLGIDTLSADGGNTRAFPVHSFAARQGVYELENVAHLELVPASGALLMVAPAKVEGGATGPVRLFALMK